MQDLDPALQQALRLSNDEDDFDAAQDLLLDAVTRKIPRSQWAYGTFLASWGRYEEAEPVLRSALANQEEGAELALAGVLEDMGHTQDAVKILLPKAQLGVPGFSLQLADTLAEHLEYRLEAEHWYLKALQQDDPDAPNNYAVHLGSLGRKEEAKKFLLQGIKAGDTKAMVNYARALSEDGNGELAIQFWQRAVSSGEVSALLDLALHYEESEQLDAAEECYLQAVTDGLPEAHVKYGIFLSELEGREADAESSFLAAIDNREPSGHWEYALYLNELGRKGEAVQQYHHAIEDGCTDAYLNLAVYHELRGEKEQAEQNYRASLDAGDVLAPIGYAEFLAENGASARRLHAVLERAREIGAPEEDVSKIERMAQL
ncbi:tetratricopeptide repeat protein [Streptomyces sp. NBC_01304]|uniref:tetratricopeptide repeat protein n=1 Tax=Streptomyces sp. NBC_01304 TaxID=2903818 RepID=UPI002E0EA379|nr:hypothetical protein OG430_41915 [Streptomyces sp. NBC_01304]